MQFSYEAFSDLELEELPNFGYFKTRKIDKVSNVLTNNDCTIFDVQFSEGEMIAKQVIKATMLHIHTKNKLPKFTLDKEGIFEYILHFSGYKDIDIVIIRENTEGLYSGVENEITPGVVMSMKVASEVACQRISSWAFKFANRRERKKVTMLHKANIMKLTDGLFLRCADEVHKNDYPNLGFESVIIDAGCMKLVQDPTQFDVLLLENLYGDVISDLCAGLVGGLGVVPGANYGDNEAVFEAVHGSAPDIAGQNLANPLALLMSAVMMLNYLAETEEESSFEKCSNLIKTAYDDALIAGETTKDLGGSLGTAEFADVLIARIAEL